MRGKMEQLETRLQDSEHEVSLKRTTGREEEQLSQVWSSIHDPSAS